jgi:hypothetical protein
MVTARDQTPGEADKPSGLSAMFCPAFSII